MFLGSCKYSAMPPESLISFGVFSFGIISAVPLENELNRFFLVRFLFLCISYLYLSLLVVLCFYSFSFFLLNINNTLCFLLNSVY